MGKVYKRPQVIRDLIELATYISQENLEAAEQFLLAAEETFRQLAKMPKMGKSRDCVNPDLANIRQQAVKGFRKYLIFYRTRDTDIEILRVLHGARDIDTILDQDLGE